MKKYRFIIALVLVAALSIAATVQYMESKWDREVSISLMDMNALICAGIAEPLGDYNVDEGIWTGVILHKKIYYPLFCDTVNEMSVYIPSDNGFASN
jgi:hypothetical protein